MSGIYNSFQIKLKGADGNAVKEVIEKTIKENNYRFFDDELVWGNVELSIETLSAEDYLGFDYDDLVHCKP